MPGASICEQIIKASLERNLGNSLQKPFALLAKSGKSSGNQPVELILDSLVTFCLNVQIIY